MAKLYSQKWKKSSFYKEKILVGLTHGVVKSVAPLLISLI
jgi:hypothetical protein